MMMSDVLYMILAFIAGMALGIFFFGGLWFTVKKAVFAKIPALWFFTSFFLRVGVVMLGFYFISPAGWQPLIVSLLGFIVARFGVTYFTKSLDKKQAKVEVYHEA
jgi:F1F0 ATPase subunit 2